MRGRGLARRHRRVGPGTPPARLPKGARRRCVRVPSSRVRSPAGRADALAGATVPEPIDELLAWLAIFEAAVQVVADVFGEPSDFAIASDHRNSLFNIRGQHGTNGVIPPKPLWTIWTLLNYFCIWRGGFGTRPPRLGAAQPQPNRSPNKNAETRPWIKWHGRILPAPVRSKATWQRRKWRLLPLQGKLFCLTPSSLGDAWGD